MATQQAEQQPQPQKPKRRKRLPLSQWIIIIIFIITIIAFGIAAYLILKNQGITQGSATLTIISIIFGVVVGLLALMFAIFQYRYPVTPAVPERTAVSPQSSSTAPTLPSYHGIVGLPPPTDPKTIQQREKVVKEVYDRLTQPNITAIALTGIGGIGKSTLAALIYHYAEEQRQAGNAPFTAESLWLTVNPASTMADLAGTLVKALGKPMLDLGTLSPQNQAAALFNALNTVDRPRLVTLDQFENLLDWQTGQALPDRVGVGEWLDALNSQPCRCRVLLTSRSDPKGTREYPPTYLQVYPVEGLEEAEGIELLRKQGVTGTETELRTAVVRCDGHAYALTLLASLIRTHNLSLATLLKDPAYAELWTGKVAEKLLDSIYKQLNELQRKLLNAFSVYREPVPLDAAQAIIDENTKVSKAQAESALNALLAQHLLQASGEGRYQLHVIVASYAQDHFVEGNEQANRQVLKVAHARAAQYYLQRTATSCPPREQRRQISDVHDLIEAIWQYCQAERWQEAYNLMELEGIFENLDRWGSNAILLELYLLLLPDKWHPKPSQAALIYNNLGEVYYALSKFREALPYLEQSLQIYREARDRKGEGEALSDLGIVNHSLGNKEQALSYFQQALAILREVGDRSGEGTTLNNLGWLSDSLGDKDQALSYYQQAIAIHREVGNRLEEGTTLNNLGALSDSLGNKEQALSYYQQALSILREVGDRRDEGTTLNNLGLLYNSLGNKEQALVYFQQALDISREVGDRSGEGTTLWNIGALYFKQTSYNVALACILLARGIFEEIQSPDRDKVQGWIDDLHQKVGRKRFATLLSQVEPQAQQIVEQALREGLGQV